MLKKREGTANRGSKEPNDHQKQPRHIRLVEVVGAAQESAGSRQDGAPSDYREARPECPGVTRQPRIHRAEVVGEHAHVGSAGVAIGLRVDILEVVAHRIELLGVETSDTSTGSCSLAGREEGKS